MKTVLWIVASLVFLAGPRSRAQTNVDRRASAAVAGASGKLTEFEVATIKPFDVENSLHSGVPHGMGVEVYPGGRVVLQSLTLERLICVAFNLSDWQVSGDDQINRDRYDVEAKAPEGSKADIYSTSHTVNGIDDERLREMLQALLIERFQLKFHRATTTGTVYVLERNGKALRLTPSEATSSSPNRPGHIGVGDRGGWALHDTSMPQLATFLSDFVFSKPVVDRTGLGGTFDFESKIILAKEEIENHDLSSTFLPALKEMGLKLQSSQGLVEQLVIDHVGALLPN